MADADLPVAVDEQGIARALLPLPRLSDPLLDGDVREALEALLRQVESAPAGSVRALVLELERGGVQTGPVLPSTREEAVQRAREGQALLRRLERLPLPTVAALRGECRGGAAEIALACSYRVALDAPGTRIGFPQVRLGLVPGLGATVRLPRLVGLQAALEVIVTGRGVGAAEAREIGLVDAMLPPAGFREGVVAFARERAERGPERGGRRRGIARRLLEDTAPGRRLALRRAAAQLLPRLAHTAPAPERALELVSESVVLPLEEGFAREAEVFGELAAADLAHGLRYAAGASARAPEAAEVPAVQRVGVLGAGAAGSVLAYLLASAGIPVRLKERRREALVAGMQRALRYVALDVGARRLTDAQADEVAERIETTSGFGGFGMLDLVIAAVGEDEDAVAEAVAKAAEHTRDDCFLAFAAATVALAPVQDRSPRPQRLVGMRLCRPTDRFRVVELVAGEATTAGALAACSQLARSVGLVPLVVADRPGGAANRLLAAYAAEALRLADDGAGAELVDRVAEEFGFAMGPFRRMDAAGVPHVSHLLGRLAGALGERFLPAPPLERVLAGEGEFYRYRAGRPLAAAPGLRGALPDDPGVRTVVRDRLLLAVINEAAHIAEEGVVESPVAADVAGVQGLGFPRVRGGPLFHATRAEPARVVERMLALAARLGPHFHPSPLLLRLAEADPTATGQRQPSML